TLPNVRGSGAPASAALPLDELSLAELLQAELSPEPPENSGANKQSSSAATAAFRAARSSAVQPGGGAKPKTSKPPLAIEADDEPSKHTTAQATQDAQREAVKNVFAVKQASRQSTKSKWAIPIIAILIVGIGSGGWYVWTEMNVISRPNIAKLPVQPPLSAQPVTAPTKIDASADPKLGLVASGDASKAELTPDLPPLLPPLATALPTPKLSTDSGVKVSLIPVTPRESLAKQIAALPVLNDPASGPVKLRLATPLSTPSSSPSLTVGYAALNAGDYALAKRHYAEAIASEATNIDANLGFATAAARSGETAMAERYYRRVLEIDPRNATAATALLTLASNSEALSPSTNLEAELNLLVSQDPNVAASHFALGNVYALQRRWSEAQTSYFEAVRLAPQNPDYAYNLAVSLDQLRQTKSAEQFYRRALATKGLAQFDRSVVERRVATLAALGGQ
ncbi:MAG: tetratricopeptide repeat protein, partial [Pseudomonadota bacterium]